MNHESAHHEPRPAEPAPLVRNRDYMLIVSAGVVSTLGAHMSRLALPLLALSLTATPVWAALLGAAQQLPYLLFSLPAGAWVDRVRRKPLLVACSLARFLLLGSIPLAYALGALSVPQLLVVVFATGVCTVLSEIADLAALPHVVHPSQLARARSVSEGIEAAAGILGPSVGGLIIGLGRTTVSGAALTFLVDSLSYLVAGCGLLGVRRPLQSPRRSAHPPIREAIRAGLRFLWRHPTLRPLMLLTTAVNFLQAPLALCALLVARDRAGLAPEQIGLVFGGAGCAALIGSALAGWLYRPSRVGPIVMAALGMWALSAAILALAGDAVVLTLGLALTYLVWPVYAVAVVSYRLEETPDALQGRVISAFRTLSYGAEPLGLALGGFCVALIGPALMFGAIAGGLLLCTAAAAGVRFGQKQAAGLGEAAGFRPETD